MTYKIFKGNNVLAGYEDTIEKAQERCDRNNGWSYMKTSEMTGDEAYQHVKWKCINKQLKPHNYTYSDVKKGAPYEYFKVYRKTQLKYLFGLIRINTKIIQRKHWTNVFKFNSVEDYTSWENYCMSEFMLLCNFDESLARFRFTSFNMVYGLSIKSEENDI